MTLLLLLFAISMVIATFVENGYDTDTAKALIYNATWFEVLMLWLILLFVANIKTYRLTQKAKWPLLVFHLAFIFMFIGGAFTRYTGFEGQMPIKEKQSSNEIISDLTYFKLNVSDGQKTLNYDKYPYRMSYLNSKHSKWPFKKTYSQDFYFNGRKISLKTLDYIPLAKDSLEASAMGKNLLNIVTIGEEGRLNNYIADGEIKVVGGIMFSYNNPAPDAVQLFEKNKDIMITFPVEGKYISMQGQQKGMITNAALLNEQSGTFKPKEIDTLNYRALYSINNTNFIIPKNPIRGSIVYYDGDRNNPKDKTLLSAIQLELTSEGIKDTLWIKGGKGVTGFSENVKLNGLNIALGFGSKIMNTNFALRCDDFLLDRYPGSNNPSSYESKITVIDDGIEKQHHIFMNNVMDYKGYRFFQASYFPNESGTILSVNADWWGTHITYLGYFLLFSGMFFTLFWKGTHFWKLNESLKKMRKHNFDLLIPFLLIVIISLDSNKSFAQANTQDLDDTDFVQKEPGPTAQFAKPGELGSNRVIDPSHAKKFGRILVQDFQGRIEPMNTHVLELLRKIYKKNKYRKGSITFSPEQWFISMQVDPGYWANEPLIKVGQKGGDQLTAETGANTDGYTTYTNLVDMNTGIFKLENQYNHSFSKRKSEQSNYDKSIIEVTERFFIFSNIAYGYYTTMIPVQNDAAQTWRSWIYSEDYETKIDDKAYTLLTNYFNGVKTGLKTGKWNLADKGINQIIEYQQRWGKKIIPSSTKINLEILYNQTNIFFWLMIVYSLLGICMTLLGFAEALSSGSKYNHLIRFLTSTFLISMIAALAVQVLALGIRWYISGHAPWSNGYEAIVFISGIGVLSGLMLYKNRNAFIPAAGALVAMIMMGFAHGGSLLDPQITNLEPVLKSYWLMIHVGIITSSYGFFGLSAVLSVISLLLFCLKPNNKTTLSIKELTIVNEMALTVGIFALTIGTFLGGMWANESWGRYWSWDPKETWAFISVIIYAVVLHLRLAPKLGGVLTFNIASLWAIWSIIFTYFGVNYYLSGLHSYAAGEPIPIPAWVYITAAGMLILSSFAYYRNKKKASPKRVTFILGKTELQV